MATVAGAKLNIASDVTQLIGARLVCVPCMRHSQPSGTPGTLAPRRLFPLRPAHPCAACACR